MNLIAEPETQNLGGPNNNNQHLILKQFEREPADLKKLKVDYDMIETLFAPKVTFK